MLMAVHRNVLSDEEGEQQCQAGLVLGIMQTSSLADPCNLPTLLITSCVLPMGPLSYVIYTCPQ